MKVEQIAVFLENKSGRLAEIADVLAANNINIRALAVADTADFGILRLIVNDTARAVQALRTAGFTVTKASVVAVEVADRPGGLAEVLKVVSGAWLNVEYMYAFVEKSGQNAAIIFRFDEPNKAISILQQAGFKILTNEEVCRL
ncbi:MAG: amino acid-binding protein [Deltaproteobacteria bacterium RIFOXYD12_FULL_57_12]|nr:MAG: amino acid-binding protein [Deltaproteobacteria bacterium RIFOXYD12_FULL_57_12]